MTIHVIPDISLSAQSATVISGLLGGTVGSILAYFGQSRLQNKQNVDRLTWLRSALLSELESMSALDAWSTDNSVPGGDWLHKQVFESVSTELGMLDSDEIHALVSFYGSAEHARSLIHDYKNNPAYMSTDMEETIKSHMEVVKRHRLAALHLLSKNIKSD